ncbi:hypothetical protein R1sor_023894 [Riccia sorocarpa]|uniref:Uncharacterized protein n=1 Tax=Riccia sorocarpa TaxID=122646 RepID=A0ABD3GP36_9MARC
MNVVGFDIGNENCIIAIGRYRGIDVVLNDECSRETPAMVSFSDKQRYIGASAASTATMNPKNSVSQIKRLIGKRFRDPEVQRDLQHFSFKVLEGSDGGPLISVDYLNEKVLFTPTQILGMILSNLKYIAEKALRTTVLDCVIGIPVYSSELQRRAYLDAAAIAELRPLRLMHETTATALAYGFYKPDLPEDETFNVVFVDIGHASMQVSLAAFKKAQLKILGQAFDRSLGGRDFDEVLFKHFAKKFKQEYSMNVSSNFRASRRLRGACEKMKKILSASTEASFNIECLMNDKDVKGHMKREEFECLAGDLLARVKSPCEKALADSGLPLTKIDAVEVVGSGSRIPAILRIIASVFLKEPSRTLNASECVARGCALQCAIMSPTSSVRHFEVQDAFPFPIAVSWKASPTSKRAESRVVFQKGHALPSTKVLTFQRSGTLSVDANYADAAGLPPGTPLKISSYQIGPLKPGQLEKVKLKFTMRLNIHGTLSVEPISLTQEEEEELETSVSKLKGSTEEFEEDFLTDTDDYMDRTQEADAADIKPNISKKQEPGMKTKKKKQTDIIVRETVMGGLSSLELQKAINKEHTMALQDRQVEEMKEKKNAVEVYVYDMKNKLSDKLQEFTTERESEELAAMLQQTEFWLYEEGEDETKNVYVAKLAELKKLGDPLEERQREYEARGQAIDDLLLSINHFREAAQSKDPTSTEISYEEREKVINQCMKAEEWLEVNCQSQVVPVKTHLPILLVEDIKLRHEMLEMFCKDMLDKGNPTAPESNSEKHRSGPNGCSRATEERENIIRFEDFETIGGDNVQRK